VHGRHEIEGLTWKALCLEVNILPLQLSQIQTPFAEAEQGRADVRQGDLEPVAGKEDTARADTSSKVQVTATPVLLGKLQRGHVAERISIFTQAVPPHELVEHCLVVIVKLLDSRSVSAAVGLLVPPFFDGMDSPLTTPADIGDVRTSQVAAQFAEQALL